MGGSPFDDETPMPNPERWDEQLLRARPRKGEDIGPIRATQGNVRLVLEHHPELADLVAYDERGDLTIMRMRPPWDRGEGYPRPIVDADVTRLGAWLEECYGVEWAGSKIHAAIDAVARGRSYDRVRDYVAGLPAWDGVERLDSWLVTYLHAAADGQAELVSIFGRKWLISAIARALRPGCKVDHMLVLEGPQGCGKSRAVRALCAEERWHADGLPDVRNEKAAAEVLQGPWIVEVAELDAVSKAEASAVKAFLTRQEDRYRAAYARRVVPRPRRCVFVATTNDASYLRDSTGGRRFWPVRLTGDQVDRDGLVAVRDQLWSEACAAYHAGESWHLDDHRLVRLAVGAQEERYHGDTWEQVIRERLDAAMSQPSPYVRVADLLHELGFRAESDHDVRHQQRVGRILHRLGWEKTRRRIGDAGRRAYVYVPCASSEPASIAEGGQLGDSGGGQLASYAADSIARGAAE